MNPTQRHIVSHSFHGGRFQDHVFDAAAKPIWEEFAEVLAAVLPEEFERLPTDAAERHDDYLRGPSREVQ